MYGQSDGFSDAGLPIENSQTISNRFQCEDWRSMLNKKEPCSDCKSEMMVVVDAAALMRLS